MLHVILDCSPLERGFTSLDHEILDPKSKSMKALMDKGFGNQNCFIFDSFPRRVFNDLSSGNRKTSKHLRPE